MPPALSSSTSLREILRHKILDIIVTLIQGTALFFSRTKSQCSFQLGQHGLRFASATGGGGSWSEKALTWAGEVINKSIIVVYKVAKR